MFVNIKGTFLH